MHAGKVILRIMAFILSRCMPPFRLVPPSRIAGAATARHVAVLDPPPIEVHTHTSIPESNSPRQHCWQPPSLRMCLHAPRSRPSFSLHQHVQYIKHNSSSISTLLYNLLLITSSEHTCITCHVVTVTCQCRELQLIYGTVQGAECLSCLF
jgi:hypothetical protein